MKAYLTVAVGCVMFASILSRFLPKGKLYSQIVNTIKIACLIVLLSPMVSLLDKWKDGKTDIFKEQEVVAVYEQAQNDQFESLIYSVFGIRSDVRVEIDIEDNVYTITCVEVTLSQYDIHLKDQIEEYLKELGYIHSNVHA